jgi:hypothetical protein
MYTNISRPSLGERALADRQSWDATSRLFNWHRSDDDGLWLDDGNEDIEAIRRVQLHPWIVDPWDGYSESDEGSQHPEVHRETILEWNAEVENHRQSAEISVPYFFVST